MACSHPLCHEMAVEDCSMQKTKQTQQFPTTSGINHVHFRHSLNTDILWHRQMQIAALCYTPTTQNVQITLGHQLLTLIYKFTVGTTNVCNLCCKSEFCLCLRVHRPHLLLRLQWTSPGFSLYKTLSSCYFVKAFPFYLSCVVHHNNALNTCKSLKSNY